MEILILLALLGGGAIIAKKVAASKTPLSSAAPPNVYGAAAGNSPNVAGSVGTVAQDNGAGYVNGTTAPLGNPLTQNPPAVVANTPAVQNQSHLTPFKGHIVAVARPPVSFQHTPSFAVQPVTLRTGRVPTNTAMPVSRNTTTPPPVTSPKTFRPAVATHPHPIVTKPHAPISPVHATGQLSAMHPEQDGVSHPLAASHGYAMHPANTPSGQRHISLQTR